MAFLRIGAAAQDQLGGDLRAGAERSDADIGAAQFLRDDAHALLAQPQSAVFFRNRQAEDAELRHFLDNLKRDVVVLQVPFVRMRRDLGVRETAHFIADLLVSVFQSGVAKRRRALALAHQFNDTGAQVGIVAAHNQRLDSRRTGACSHRAIDTQIGEADDLALVHGDAAKNLRQILAKGETDQQYLDFTQTAFALKPFGIGAHLAQRFHIGGEPGEAVGGPLFRLHTH